MNQHVERINQGAKDPEEGHYYRGLRSTANSDNRGIRR